VFDLTGRVALVTGAGQGVGEGIARALAAQGASVVVNDVEPERATTVASSIENGGGTARPGVFDVTDLDAVRTAVAEIGQIDVLVNNAGNAGTHQMGVQQFRDMDPQAWDAPIRVNLYGVLNCCHAVVDGMCDRNWGRIITISSGAGTSGVRIGVAPYSAGKGGSLAFSRTLALEVARQGVTVNSVAIGLMGLPDPVVTASMAKSIPVGRTGEPSDIGAACVWLASDEASWVTGQTIQVNGGSVTT
jgi:NAD(P)-dependent dehydrogenase (short-subunit alcohol dehydrogenase family)